MKKAILSICFIAACSLSYGQSAAEQEYNNNVAEAEKLYDQKDYARSAQHYSKAFAALGGKGMPGDRYNAACTWALAGNADSAFFQLERIATKSNYTDLNHLLVDTDLTTLRNDKRWNEVVAIVKQNKEKLEANYNKPVVAMLDTIMMEDQKYRMEIEAVEKKYGRDSKEMKAHWKKIEKADEINLKKVTAILDKYGWMGPDEVGRSGNSALFLVIQHADHKTQKKYLPIMREAVNQNKANPSHLAMLEDRVALGEGKKQVYGSQIGMDQKTGKYYVSPLEDPDNVDKRRADVGLGPLSEYVRNWQLEWNVEEYKKQLPQIEAMEKK